MKLKEELKVRKFRNGFHEASLNIIFTANWIRSKFEQLMKEYGITEPQYNVLRILRGKYPEPAHLHDISDRMIDKSSNVTRLIDKLISKDFVSREICKDNRRKINILIEAKGLRLLEELDPRMLEVERNLFSNLTEEDAADLSRKLDKIRE